MIDMTGSVLSSLQESTRPADQKMVEALESRLADDERVVSRLSSSGKLTHERDGETSERGGGDGGVLFVATDRKLVFVLDTPTGRETADIPYTDLKDATVDSGFFSTTVSVRVWGRGQFSLSPSKADDVSEIIAYITTASELWQRVVAALQDARQHISVLGSAIEDGRTAKAEAARQSARECIEKARERASDAPVPLRDAIASRIETVATELQRTRTESHFQRGETLTEQTTPVTETGEYDATYADWKRAREQFEMALRIAAEEGFDGAGDAQAEIAAIDERLSTLETQPLARAERARERAQRADDTAEAIGHWESALERYRNALEAGWGTDADFDGETDALRMQIEWVVTRLLALRQERARELESTGDDIAWSDSESARKPYEQARDHLDGARRLAAVYRAGDPSALALARDRLDDKIQSV